MPIDISPLTPERQLSIFAQRNQRNLQDVGVEIATNLKYQSFDGYSEEGNLEKLLSLDSTLTGIEAFQRSNTNVLSRVDTTIQVVNQIQDIANSFRNDLLNRNDVTEDAIELGLIGESALDRIASNLNITFDGRYLFAGSKVDTRPVVDIQTTNINPQDGSYNSRYYEGDSLISVLRNNTGEEIEYGVLANEEAFQQLIGSIHLAIDGHTNDDESTIDDAIDLIDTAIGNLVAVNASVRSSRKLILESQITLESSYNLVFDIRTEIANTDLPEATTRMAAGEANLQAIYIALNRITRLSLANFIN